MPRTRFSVIAVCVATIAALSAWFFVTPWMASTPSNLSELRALESKIKEIAEASIPAVVAVQQPKPNSPGFASGAIISSDGLIVSSFHVSHQLRPYGVSGADVKHLNAGDMATVVLADGTECEAELLGADITSDISLLKLVAPGPYPFLKVSADAKLNLGDWIIEIGHPTGLQRNRTPVVRVGRVLVSESEFFVSDCNITGGDSGGPLINLDGEVVGIPSFLVADEKNDGQSYYAWARNKSGSPILHSVIPANQIHSNWKTMLDGKILPFRGDTSRLSNLLKEVNRILPDRCWTRGRSVKEPFHFAARDSCSWVVRILDSSDRQVSLGTICSSEGYVATLNSTLPDTPRCQMENGKIVDCNVILRDDRCNLAVLRIPSEHLSSVQWMTGDTRAPVGSFVVAPIESICSDEHSFNVGIVSTPILTPINGVAYDYFEIDMRLSDESCGGPVVNLDCEAVGVSVRSHLYGTYVVPATKVKALLERALD